MIATNRASLARVQGGVNMRERERTLLTGAALMVLWLAAAAFTFAGGGPYWLLLVQAAGVLATARFVYPCLTGKGADRCGEGAVDAAARAKRAA